MLQLNNSLFVEKNRYITEIGNRVCACIFKSTDFVQISLENGICQLFIDSEIGLWTWLMHDNFLWNCFDLIFFSAFVESWRRLP